MSDASDLEAKLDRLSTQFASYMTDAQQYAFWNVYHPVGGLPNPAAGIAWLQDFAARLEPRAPDFDALGLVPLPPGRWHSVCPTCHGTKARSSQRCAHCARAARIAQKAAA